MIKNFARLEPNYNGLRRVNKELPASDWNAIRNYLHTYEALLETTKVLTSNRTTYNFGVIFYMEKGYLRFEKNW